MYDGTSGFVVDNLHPQTVKVDIGDPIILDCRTTRPDIKVSVFKKDNEIPRNKYKFNPRVGVTLEGRNYIGSELQCRNNISNDKKLFAIEMETCLMIHSCLRQDVTDEFTLDYRRWFTKPAVSLQETGIYSCKEKKFGGEKTFLVNIQPQKKLQKPSIENHRNSFYVVGRRFCLKLFDSI
ncbi:hypothetical protein Avbf_13384 [Armadillidium vulgare]|nr:hypothetical protein Avbf_13384 [Armadillidium vulgare]